MANRHFDLLWHIHHIVLKDFFVSEMYKSQDMSFSFLSRSTGINLHPQADSANPKNNQQVLPSWGVNC